MKLLIIPFLFISYLGLGQSDSHSLSWTLEAIGYRSYRSIDANESAFKDVAEQWNELEKASYKGGMGLGLRFSLSERITIQSGLQWAQRGYQVDTIQDASITGMKIQFSAIELPIKVNYLLMEGKAWNPYVSLGVSLGYMVRSKTTLQKLGQTANFDFYPEGTLQHVQIGAVGSFGLIRAIDDQSELFIGADYYQSFSPIIESTIERRLNHLGIRFGISRGF